MCAFGLKFPIDVPKIELLGASTDRIGSGNKLTPKKTFVVAKTRHLMQRSSKRVRCLQDSGCPSSWIYGMVRNWNTDEVYMVVFTVVQNLVRIDAVVLIL